METKDTYDPYIEFEYKGITCKYHKDYLKNPHGMEYVAKELQEFVKFFSDPNPEVSWHEVHDDPDRDVYDFFVGMHHISNEWFDLVEVNLFEHSNDLDYSFEQACKEATEILKKRDEE